MSLSSGPSVAKRKDCKRNKQKNVKKKERLLRFKQKLVDWWSNAQQGLSFGFYLQQPILCSSPQTFFGLSPPVCQTQPSPVNLFCSSCLMFGRVFTLSQITISIGWWAQSTRQQQLLQRIFRNVQYCMPVFVQSMVEHQDYKAHN